MSDALIELLKSKPGVSGGVGRRAVSAALAAGYSESQINAAAQHADIQALDKGGLQTSIDKIGTQNSGWFGDAGDTSAIQAMEAGAAKDAAIAAYHEKQGAHAGAADVASMRIGDQSWTDIQSFMGEGTNQNPDYSATGSSDYSRMLQGINLGAGLESAQAANLANQGKIGTLASDLGTLQGNYSTLQGKYDSLTKKYTGLQTDVAQAAKDAMKIKYTGSTQVRNPSAMGIQAAQGTPFRGSGLAGTAALARPNKGLKIKTLNV